MENIFIDQNLRFQGKLFFSVLVEKFEFFSYGKSNSCGILTAYFWLETFTVKKQQIDKEVVF